MRLFMSQGAQGEFASHGGLLGLTCRILIHTMVHVLLHSLQRNQRFAIDPIFGFHFIERPLSLPLPLPNLFQKSVRSDLTTELVPYGATQLA